MTRLLAAAALPLLSALPLAAAAPAETAPARPNILWLTSEDNGPHLGCYGDAYAVTPNLDKLAARSLIYRNAWSNAPVCAPARTTVITGVYPTSTGSEHMRSMTRLPESMRMFPALLREAGYYCTNNSKEDYNLAKAGVVWDESSNKAHYKNRTPGRPFFAVFNDTGTHESQIRKRPHTLVHDPAKVRLPAYHPDTPEVRHDWAQYYDNLTTMDARMGAKLKELADAGLADDTIVVYWGDHGSGMPRSKRWPYDSGLHVPLIVHVPEKFRKLAGPDYAPGAKTDRLVAFVDLAPTMLSLAGIKPPEWMQGRAFLGTHVDEPNQYLHGFRGRMDERCDMVRTVRDGRYVYVRNYLPHLPYGQHVSYMFQTQTTKVWQRLHAEGRLNPAQAAFWGPKPPEELYDLQSDPDEVRNLAGSPEHKDVLERFRKAQRDHALAVRDVGFLPEGEIHSRSAGSSPYEVGHDDAKYPLARILAAAELASSLKPEALPELKSALADPDSAVRWWAAQGILMRGREAVSASRAELAKAGQDASPYVRLAAAEALGRFGGEADVQPALTALVELASADKHGSYVAVAALNAIDRFDAAAVAPHKAALKALPRPGKNADGRTREYVPRLLEHILGE